MDLCIMVVMNREICVVARCVHDISWMIIDKRQRRPTWLDSDDARFDITPPGMTQLAMKSDTGANVFYTEVDVGCSKPRVYLAGVYTAPPSHISFCLALSSLSLVTCGFEYPDVGVDDC